MQKNVKQMLDKYREHNYYNEYVSLKSEKCKPGYSLYQMSQYRDLFSSFMLLSYVLGPTSMRSKSFIDLGCGKGELIKYLEDFSIFYKTAGIEHSIEYIRDSVCKSDIIIGDAFNKMMLLRKYDIIYMFNIIHNYDLKRKKVHKLMQNMQSKQILIECYDWSNNVLNLAKKMNFEHYSSGMSIIVIAP